MTYSATELAKVNAYNADIKDAINNPGDSAWIYVSGSPYFETDNSLAGFITDGGYDVKVSDLHPYLIEMIEEEAESVDDLHETELHFDDALIYA